MSADNGIYILRTPSPFPQGDGSKYEGDGYEYRVTHAQAIDNLWYCPQEWEEAGVASSQSIEENGNPREIVNYFGDVDVLMDRTEALVKADEMLQELTICEYGISFIYLSKTFDEYRQMAQQLPKTKWEE